jgi:hypothetical protein
MFFYFDMLMSILQIKEVVDMEESTLTTMAPCGWDAK